jgi:MFS family permease
MWALGTVIGPLLGGGFAQSGNWEWIFWINLPFIGVGAAMVIIFLSLNYKTSSFLAKLRRVDWIGSGEFHEWQIYQGYMLIVIQLSLLPLQLVSSYPSLGVESNTAGPAGAHSCLL